MMLDMKPVEEPTPRYLSLYQKIDAQGKLRQRLLDEIEERKYELHHNLEPELIEDYQDFILELTKKAGSIANLFNMIEGKPLCELSP